MENDEKTLESDFPSLKLGYEQVKDTLHKQATIVSNYVNRAITLFAVATAVIGIGLPLLYTAHIPQQDLIVRIPAIVLLVIPASLYACHFRYLWRVIRPEFIKTVASPKILLAEEYLELETNNFYSEVIQDVASTFSENEDVIREKERNLIKLIKCVTWEAAVVVILVLLFSSFGFFG